MNVSKTLSLLFFLFASLFVTAQSNNKQLYIEYEFFLGGASEKVELKADWEHSYSKTLPRIDHLNGYQYKIKCAQVYKDYSKGILVCEDRCRGQVLVQEPLNLFKWNLTNKTDNILGYQCRQAKCIFRGRDYVAWFTIEIPFKAAPWKFHGLPGVMLKVYTTDDYMRVEAKLLKIRTISDEIQNPYKGKKYMSWKEFKNLYIKKSKEEFEWTQAVFAKYGYPAGHPPKGSSDLRAEIILESNRRMVTREEEAKEFEKYEFLGK